MSGCLTIPPPRSRFPLHIRSLSDSQRDRHLWKCLLLKDSVFRSQTWFQTFSWSPEYKCAWKWNNWEDRTNLLQTENLRHQTYDIMMFNWAPMYISYWHWIGCCVGSSIRAEYKRNSLTALFVNFTLKGFVGWAEPIGLSSPKTSTITFFGLTSVLSLQARSLLQIIACHLSVLLGKEQIVKYGVGPKCEGRQIWSLDKAKLQHSSEGVKFTR